MLWKVFKNRINFYVELEYDLHKTSDKVANKVTNKVANKFWTADPQLVVSNHINFLLL